MIHNSMLRGLALYLLNSKVVLMQNSKNTQSRPQMMNNTEGLIIQSFWAKGILYARSRNPENIKLNFVPERLNHAAFDFSPLNISRLSFGF